MNVREALHRRLDRIFGEFDEVVVSFSGGKDSGVLLAETLAHALSIRLTPDEIMRLENEAKATGIRQQGSWEPQ